MSQNTKCYKVLNDKCSVVFTKCYSVLNVTKYYMLQSNKCYKVPNVTKYNKLQSTNC